MVKVTIAKDPHDGEPLGIEEHPDGHSILVREGHLGVNVSRGDTIAIYAPGQWVSAVVEQ